MSHKNFGVPHDGAPVGIISVTPDNDADLPKICRVLMVTGAGNVAVQMIDGSEDILPGLQPGTQYVGYFRRVMSTGTTATGIKGLI